MDEAEAYQWAVQALRNCKGEQHKREQCIDLVATAIMRAYEHGQRSGGVLAFLGNVQRGLNEVKGE